MPPRPVVVAVMARPLQFALFALLVSTWNPALPVSAAEPPGYYDAATGLTGRALHAALHNIIRNHTALSYVSTANALMTLHETPGDTNRVTLTYNGRAELKRNFIGFGNPGTAGWNREHLWPNSFGIDSVEPSFSDLNNLRPCDQTVNSQRASLPFDNSSMNEGRVFPAHAEALQTSRDVNSWEPMPDEKGDIARAMFYMDVRYDDDAPNENDLVLTDNLDLINNSSAYCGRLTTLLLWSLSDPVSDAERARNEGVYARQGNRNPFIDHPQWAVAVYSNPSLHFTAPDGP